MFIKIFEMFIKNVFASRLESIICKTINVRACVRVARRPCAWFPIPIPLLS